MALSSIDLARKCEQDIDYAVHNIHLFTWNPNDRFMPEDDVTKWDTMILRHLKHLTRVSRCFCMIAELSPSGRLHCHGWFSLDDRLKWNKSVKKHFYVNGNMKFNKMRSAKALDNYYVKEVDRTMEDTSISADHIVFCHRNYKTLLGMLKQKYFNKRLEAQKKLTSRSLLEYLDCGDFAEFQDDMN